MFALAKSAPKFAAASKVAVRGVATRTESDLLGSLEVPADHYYGVQTMRGYNSYDISGKTVRLPQLHQGLRYGEEGCHHRQHASWSRPRG